MSQEGEIIACSQPEFSDYVCMTYDNLAELEAEIEKFKDKYDGLIGLMKALVKSSIKKREGQDTEDLSLLLNYLESGDVKK